MYPAAGDLSAIDTTFVMDGEAYQLLMDTLDRDIRNQLMNLLCVRAYTKSLLSRVGEEQGTLCVPKGVRYAQRTLQLLKKLT